jgi:hypothetical protein
MLDALANNYEHNMALNLIDFRNKKWNMKKNYF